MHVFTSGSDLSAIVWSLMGIVIPFEASASKRAAIRRARRLKLASFLLLFSAVVQAFSAQVAIADNTNPKSKREPNRLRDDEQVWKGSVEFYDSNPHGNFSNHGVGSAKSLNWIRLDRLGENGDEYGIDPSMPNDAERLRMGWNKINFQNSGLRIQNVKGLDWCP